MTATDDNKQDQSTAKNVTAEASTAGLPEPGSEVFANKVGTKNEYQSGAAGTAPPRSSSARRSRAGTWVAWALLVVVMAALGTGGYFAWPLAKDYQQRFQTLEENNQSQQRQLSNAVAQLQQLRQSVVDQQQALAGVEDDNRALRVQLGAQNDSIRALSATTTDDWKLAEAYYLTRLASQRLAMERNTQGAIALLQAADDIVNRHLQNHADHALTTVRQQIAQDVVALKVVGSVDREGMFFTINAIMEQINHLPQAQPLNYRNQHLGAEDSSETASTVEEVSVWQRMQESFQQALANSKDLIRIDHHDQPIAALPAPDQQQLLIYRVQTLLLSAQLSLLREQPQIFNLSLQQVEQLLTDNYPLTTNPDFQAVKGIVATLKELQSQSIVQALPDISRSQQQLGNYLDRLHRIGATTSSDKTPQPETSKTQPTDTAPQDVPL